MDKKKHVKSLKELESTTNNKEKRNKLLGDIASMLERKNINIDEIGDIKKVSMYQTVTKDEEGRTEIHDLAAIQFSPSWDQGPEWPVITRGPQIQVQKTKTKVGKPTGWQDAVILPDIQIGYYRKSLDSFDLEPIHDESAINVALQVVRDMNPHVVCLLGDNLDFAELGKYLTAAPFKQLVQAAIDRATMLCAQVREAAPRAKIYWIAGNHEARMARYIQTNAEAAFGITRGKLNDELRDSWPALSVPYLCRMDEFDVEYVPGYPESYVSLNSNLNIIHGHKVNSGGSTATKYLNDAHVSVIYGHIHRQEILYRTRLSTNGPRTIMAASPGCLCRIDGAVPSTKSGQDEFGRPLLRGAENWQQGLAIVQFQPHGVGNEWFNYEPMWIYQGRGFFRGKEYVAQ